MHKANQIGLYLVVGTLLTSPLVSPALEKAPSSQIQPIVFSQIEGTDWVRKCIDQYPEIRWLADANVRKTEEGQAAAQGPYSEQLFGQKFIEFDRTIMTLRCLKWILDGSEKAYQEFTAAQAGDVKLSIESFKKLHEQGEQLVKSRYLGLSETEMIQAMEASLVLGDIGKSEKAREVFKSYGASAPDHDDFHGEVMQILQHYPELSPTFERLTPKAQQLLRETANLAHYGHVTHIEGGPGMFSKLKESALAVTSPIALSFDLFVHTCDVAGALGHVNQHSSLVYTEPSHKAMQAVRDACLELKNPNKTEMDAYNVYLTQRAKWLGLNPQDRFDRVLTRVGAMLRLFTPEEGRVLRDAFLKINPDLREKIVDLLDSKMGEDFARTPTYMPAVLVNLSNNPQLGGSKEERLAQAVVLGLPFLSKILEMHKVALKEEKANPEIPLNFNKAAGVAKSAPNDLLKEFQIDAEGNVHL